jgi:hypothetical protein
MDQNVRTTDAPTFAALNTGQGNYELYDMNQNVKTTDNVTFNGLTITTGFTAATLSATSASIGTINTGYGDNELYAMNQNVQTGDAVTFATVNTGQGANELFAMDQNVRTSDAVTFATVNTGQGANELYAMNQNVQTGDDVTFANLIATTNIATGTLSASAASISTLNTGLGDNELYAMNQNVRTTDAVEFATLNTGLGATELYAMNQNVRTGDAVTFDGLTVSTTLALPNNSVTNAMVADDLTISGGSVNNSPIGASTPSSGVFTTLSATSINNTPIGNSTPSTGAFTTLGASGAVTITNATESGSPTQGALVVTGGVGIGGNANVGGNVNVVGNASISGDIGITSDLTVSGNAYFGDGGGDAFVQIETESADPSLTLVNYEGLALKALSDVKIDANLETTGLATLAEVEIASGTIDGTVIGNSTPAAATFTTLTANISFTAASINATPIGNLTPSTGAFTSLAATGNTALTGNLSVGGSYTSTNGDLTLSTGALTAGGITTLGSSLGVTGATTLNNTLSVVGDVAVNTNKFMVNALTGNTTVAGTLGVTNAATFGSTLAVASDVAVNTNKFNVTGATGNTAIAGTLNVGDAGSFSNSLTVEGTTTLNGNMSFGGNTDDNIAVNGTITSTSLFFEGSSVDANDLEIQIANPTAPRTIIFPNASGTLALNENLTLQGVYDNNNVINTTSSGPVEIVSNITDAVALSVTSNNGGSAITAYTDGGSAIYTETSSNVGASIYATNASVGLSATEGSAGYFWVYDNGNTSSPAAAVVAYNEQSGPGLYSFSTDAEETGTAYAVYAATSGTATPAVYAENINTDDAAVAMQLAGGKIILKTATATGTGNLSGYGYANVITVNQNITTMPEGVDGQVLYLYNSSGSTIDVLTAHTIPGGTIMPFIYLGGKWISMTAAF